VALLFLGIGLMERTRRLTRLRFGLWSGGLVVAMFGVIGAMRAGPQGIFPALLFGGALAGIFMALAFAGKREREW
jgi:hypothetical protein